MQGATASVDTQGSLKGLQQVRVTEGLEKALDGPAFQQSGEETLASVSGNEHDRNFLAARCQFSLQIGARHARHGHVEDETSGLVNVFRRKKLFRRRKSTGLKAELPQQIRERLANGFVVINYGYK
jgi:hypothetical protein